MTVLLVGFEISLLAQTDQKVEDYRISEYLHWYPTIKQVEMLDMWLENYKPGEWQISGIVTAEDRTVVTVQADGLKFKGSKFIKE